MVSKIVDLQRNITNSIRLNLNLNFKPRITKLINLLNVWKQRNLSLTGSITIINTLALAPLIYLSSTTDTPDERDNILLNFSLGWEHLKDCTAHLNRVEGLKLCNFEIKTKSLN